MKTDLKFKIIGDNKFEVLEDFIFIYNFAGFHLKFIVPKGFKTDGFSIPKIFTPIQSATGLGVQIAVLHDYFYSEIKPEGIIRRQADFIFYEGLRCLNVPTWKAKLIYTAVVFFGGKRWKRRVI